jgi:hypothetical protein
MGFIRTIMAATIALSVALLPTAGAAGFMLEPKTQEAVDAAAMPMEMASDADSAMHDCCPDQGKNDPGDHAGHRCPMVCCGAAVVSIAAPDAPSFDLPVLAGPAPAIPVDQIVSPHSGSPPFRPPRV